ncbi:30S ribosomal protein S12 methylthiotransferase RimO [Bdellovibrio bacteriovorus]|uniref:Ribosomal protein uS12 methylthiotransferase RimO n=2 Tax=Bdellovibrio bacteriovorus TaxID=959 RepID=RIMO_BDEBA|nr:30S ribosomal protein S12 methylthiotransferase RimO [Bdellovibrio bacteriovorus]Q6MGT1.1 RecName: Full=Ribosomal protein uS12 methylthiotransferase RimO; Short=uS12 MTTase; Short=uS12 methylthiotransferase; AltName: Full=Ribosomal protein uS12 (aspartate-C(3))-methylthiotransferase; AltName: Full=Ribosome maturation factor RimO [Bdellovibrio bacteriovorus HD100]AHZ85593.1 ribosomal protein S12 methylthiotransferase [Bdellovibrio bacteriovorus]ASD62151.1 30S ribosomal protein S12 methylthiotr
MKQETAQNKKVHFISLGCPKNLVDSEIMAGTLMKDGYEVVGEADQADTVIVNTCGFIEDSKKESIQRILDMSDLKQEGKIKKVVVAGCLTQRYKDDLVEGLPEADLFVGSGEFQNIAKILKNSDEGEKQKTFFNLPTYLQEEATPRVNSQPGHRAYLKISEGCMKRCAFCAIPLIRGNLQSRSIDAIVAEAKLLVAGGVKELIIISHDFTDYGFDIRRKDPTRKESPVELLKALDQVEGLQWIRLMYLYPDGITQEMVQVIKNSTKIVKYFDMPLQHVNDQVLKSMNRKMTRDEIETALMNIREHLPEAVIRTQFIVGFPGETQEQFEELLNFVAEQQFDRVGCFKYSPEENTPGGRMENQIDEETKQYRHDALMEVQQNISREKHSDFVGKTLQVIVEGFSEETDLLLQGRFWGQAPDIDGVVLINDGQAQVGDMVKVHITDNMEYDLIGEIVVEN